MKCRSLQLSKKLQTGEEQKQTDLSWLPPQWLMPSAGILEVLKRCSDPELEMALVQG